MLALKLSIDWYEQQLVIQKINVEKLNAEIDFLRAQINPHFLFNILNNLYALTLSKSDHAPEVILKLSEMMEYMLYDSSSDKVLLEKEISYLNNYIELEQLRLNYEADVKIKINGVIQGIEIAPLLLLPLVENAFKHGLSIQTIKSWMTIDIDINQTTLTVKVDNIKTKIDGDKNKGGIGLDNLRKRLSLIYPSRHQLTLEKRPDSFMAKLVIDL